MPEISITLRAVRAEDEEFLVSLYRSTRETELAIVPWSAEQKDMFVRTQFTAQKRHYASEYPAADHDLVCVDQATIGRLYLARQQDVVHIIDVTVAPEHRKRGVGSALLRRIMDSAAKERKPVTIYVETFNPSLDLFRKLGFLPERENGLHVLLKWTPAP